STGIGWGFSDTLCLLGLFIISALLLRLSTETLAPAMVRFPTPIYHLGRLFFGLAGSIVTVAIILLGFEVAPVHKKVFTVVDYTTKPPFGQGLDRAWLAFFQYTTGMIFPTYDPAYRDPLPEYGSSNVFDPRAERLSTHQEGRPYGGEGILEGEGGGGGGAEGGAPAPAPGGPPGAPGMPGASGERPGAPKIAGPAVGGG